MTEEFIIKVPGNGRTHDDRLSPVERAVVDYLAGTDADRLRAVIEELVSLARLRVEIEIALREGL
jgi:hypothetical protein